MLSELAFSADDLARTRFAVAPMWEVATSFRLLAGGTSHPAHRSWLDQVRPRVAAAGLTTGWLADLVPAHGYLADFLTPFPAGANPTFEAELAAIRATPPDQVRADVDMIDDMVGGTTARRQALRADPRQRLARLTAEIEVYWELALAPYWAKIRALLDADVFHRARQVAERGAGHLLNDLHATVRWDANTLQLVRRHCTVSRRSSVPGLVLLPSAFATRVLTWDRPPHPPQLAYPARGTAMLWEQRPVAHADAIAAVLGRSRAMLLTELGTPASTTELARRTGISAAGISQHLTALRDAGIVSSHRAGRSVLYARTSVAESLLGLAD